MGTASRVAALRDPDFAVVPARERGPVDVCGFDRIVGVVFVVGASKDWRAVTVDGPAVKEESDALTSSAFALSHDIFHRKPGHARGRPQRSLRA